MALMWFFNQRKEKFVAMQQKRLAIVILGRIIRDMLQRSISLTSCFYLPFGDYHDLDR
jgi:hypothetical protein